MSTWSRGRLALPVSLLIIATFYYVPRFFFTQDDFGWLMLARDAWHGPAALFTVQHGSFTPLSNAVFRALYSAGGLAAWPYFATNLALHLVATLLVLRLAHEVLSSRLAAFAAAAFFATTFSHWEAVMWLAGGLPQVLATCLVLASLLFFGAHLRNGGKALLALSVAAFALGLLAKETAVTAPLLTLLYVWLVAMPQRDAAWRSRAAVGGGRSRSWLGLAMMVGVAASYLAYQAVGYRFTRLIDEGLYPARLGGHVATNLLRYLFMLLAPDPRAPVVAAHLESLSPALTAALRAAAMGSLWLLPLAVVALVWRGGKTERFAVLWIVIALLPFVPILLTPASRYLYLPSVGAALLFGILVNWAERARGAALGVAVLVAVLLLNWTANRLAGETRLRNSEARRDLIASVMRTLDSRPGAATVYLTGVPERYADLCDAVRLFVARPLRCVLDGGANFAAVATKDGALVWVYAPPVQDRD